MKTLQLIFLFLWCFAQVSKAQSIETLKSSTVGFLSSLSAEERMKTQYSFNDSLRRKWTNLPVGQVPRAGIAYGSLSDQSRLAYHRVLASVLASQGYLKTTSIMALDDILNTLYQSAYDQHKISKDMLTRMQNLKWAYGNYFISVWGKPETDSQWGLNFGGHHMALNLSIVDQKISIPPFFIGTDPAEVKVDKYAGLRVLAKEEDYGFMLVNSLNSSQQSKAILKQQVPGDIITNPNSSQRIDNYYGLAAKEMDAAQQKLLRLIINEYLHNFEHFAAHAMEQKLQKSKMENVYFAWIGSLENNKPHYYLINSPDFLIEYDNVGFQKDGNHIHAILRDKNNDFGDDLLKQHYLNHKH